MGLIKPISIIGGMISMKNIAYCVQYWDTKEDCWGFAVLKEDEFLRLKSNPRFEIRDYSVGTV